jgi:hypothetical protein
LIDRCGAVHAEFRRKRASDSHGNGEFRCQRLFQIANCRRELHDHANANRGRDGFIKAITDEPHHVISQRQVIEVDGAEIE